MAAHAYRQPAPYDDVPLRRRASGLGLAIALNLLVILILLGLGTQVPISPVTKGGIKIFNVSNDNADDTRPKSSASKPPPSRPPKTHPPMVKPTISTPVPPPSDRSPEHDKPWIELTRPELSSIDQALAENSDGGHRGQDSEVVGTGPNGETLYAAEWAREPTDQELGYYLPPDRPDGAGLIMCKTIPDNRVDDCIAIESIPASSRLASAVLKAAWQFKIRPPRKNGQPMIGTWVRIRIDYVTVGKR